MVDLYVPLVQNTHNVPLWYVPTGHEHTVAPDDVVHAGTYINSEPFPLFDAVSDVTVAPEIA